MLDALIFHVIYETKHIQVNVILQRIRVTLDQFFT